MDDWCSGASDVRHSQLQKSITLFLWRCVHAMGTFTAKLGKSTS